MLKKVKNYGVEEGKKNKQITIARKMKNKNYALEEIMELTGLTKEEINNV